MRVLVITDNYVLLHKFKEIVNVIVNQEIKFDVACSSSSYEGFKKQMEHPPFIVKVKEDYLKIISEYDLVISMHCKQIFPREMVEKIRCINIHPGLNPYNRGWYPQAFSIINGYPHGATIHEIDAKLDHGPIIAQEIVPVHPWDTSLSVYKKVQKAEVRLIRLHINDIVKKTYVARLPEQEGNINLIKDFREMCELDMDEHLTMRQAIDRLRALTHPPYKNAYFLAADGKKIDVEIKLSLSKK